MKKVYLNESTIRRIVAESLRKVLKENNEFGNGFFFNYDKDETDANNQGYHKNGEPLSPEEMDDKKKYDMDQMYNDYGNVNTYDNPFKDEFDSHVGLEAQHKHNTPVRAAARVGGSTRKPRYDAYADAFQKNLKKNRF